MGRPDYVLFDRNTKAIFWNLNRNAIQRMLDYDYTVGRTPSIVAIVAPTQNRKFEKFFFGTQEIMIPIYKSTVEAAEKHPEADVLVNFASFRTAYNVTIEALNIPTIRTVAITAEGIPERLARDMAYKAKQLGKWIIGPATVGGIAAGAFRIGNAGGTIENIVKSKLHRPGSCGLVTRSGGLFNELSNIIARNADGIVEGIAIGGDRFPGSDFLDHLIRFQKNPQVKYMIMLGEVGGELEYKVAEAIKSGLITKPVIAWCIGTIAKHFGGEVQFGHAGAKAGADRETADAKNRALKEAGAIVPDSFNDFPEVIREVYEDLKAKGEIGEIEEPEVPPVPEDYAKAVKAGKVRRPTNFICTISDDRGEEATYCGIPISEVVEKDYSIADVIGLLWFKKKFPAWASKFIDMVIKVVADHGPAVSGAHNAKVTARAGKDLMSCLATGILTIGPRFGGAIDGAAKYFKMAKEKGMDPYEFVDYMKNVEKIPIPGIGHRIKSTKNPDKRVELLKNFAKENFPSTELLDYALEVEKVTTAKKENLILNVDGTIGVLLVDMFRNLGYTDEEIDELINAGAFNAFFVLGRSIGFIGHILDEKRLAMPLYRHPWDDILYDVKRPEEA
ncbi:ATP citrate synthase [Desulfurobacterium thermolithotrophum DSM 11699]|uniref:ATP citrate synthase n=1 Tax=Desulfurobacterium thermolithotrophum (strain DSM 11699 / BSA) TaxID=868864 RepID=F0S092_DESTD|nr:citrate/2-methylcitrate synthase [Desulfurobacterium thermolithotrophum]ADY73771.1 ATP citrate synthase [Desulfurobacterium thermolithotrophum DSM 11699]